MFYVYVLKISKGGQLYIGYSSNLKRRVREHVQEKSAYTKSRGPLRLIYYEAYLSEKDARDRERILKEFKGSYGHLRKRIKESIESA
jgi:putative endonuclease